MFSGGEVGCKLWLLYSEETVCPPVVYIEKVGDQVEKVGEGQTQDPEFFVLVHRWQ